VEIFSISRTWRRGELGGGVPLRVRLKNKSEVGANKCAKGAIGRYFSQGGDLKFYDAKKKNMETPSHFISNSPAVSVRHTNCKKAPQNATKLSLQTRRSKKGTGVSEKKTPVQNIGIRGGVSKIS